MEATKNNSKNISNFQMVTDSINKPIESQKSAQLDQLFDFIIDRKLIKIL